MRKSASADRSTAESQGRGSPVFLLFSPPGTDTDAMARAAHAAGLNLAADAAGSARYAMSAALEAAASEIDALFGAQADGPGPLILANRSPALSRRRIDKALEAHLARARTAISEALPVVQAGRVVAAGSMGTFPRFWIKAMEQSGIDVRPVLLWSDPLAVAQRVRSTRGEPLRQTLFAWHHSVLETLAAAPARLAVTDREGDLEVFGLPAPAAGDQAARTGPSDAEDLSQSGVVSEQTRVLEQVLRQWPKLERKARVAAIEDLRARFDEAVTLTGAVRIVTLPGRAPSSDTAPQPEPATAGAAELGPEQASAPAVADKALRPLLLHYHIFKNAGTSVDRMLRANFGERWLEHEFTGGTIKDRNERFREFLAQRTELDAFSSHTAMLPVPVLPGRKVFPVIFVRHPLLRLRSAYQFERRQDAETKGALLAKSTDLAGYLTALLDDPKMRQARNFQGFRFAAGTPGPAAHEARRARETLAALPFVGLVEAYDESVERLGQLVRPLFPDFRAMALHENATSADRAATVADKLDALRGEIGPALFDRLVAENALDLELFERVSSTYSLPA